MAHTCLAKILREKKITKYSFAKLVKEPTSNVARYFRANYDPRFSTIEKWARALNVSVKELVED